MKTKNQSVHERVEIRPCPLGIEIYTENPDEYLQSSKWADLKGSI